MIRRSLCIVVILGLFSAIFLTPSGILLAGDVSTQASTTRFQDETLKIAQFVDSGASIDDGGFNTSTRQALQIAEERYGAEIEVKQAIDPADREADLISLAEAGTDIIITIGFNLQEATNNVAREYPNVRFIGVDQFQGETIDNVSGLIFPEDRSGFLAGVLAASLTQTNMVSGVYGTAEVPPVVAFREGYESGIRWAAERLGRQITISGTYHPGTVFDAFSDPDWGATTAAVALEEGSDVIFTAAGGTGIGALQEVAFNARSADSPIYCIGVDTDQWLTVEDAHPCLVTSAQKLITNGVVELIEAYLNGTIQGGNFVGDVGLAPFHDFEGAVTDEMRTLLTEAERGLRNGSIQTCYLVDLANFHGEGQPLRIGMVAVVGQLNDGGYNESTWNGLLAVERCGAEVSSIETRDAADYAANIAEFTGGDYDIVVTVGADLQAATTEAAEEHPEIRFIGVDQRYEDPIEGVTGLLFPNDHSGFLAGYMAASISQSGTIAAILGSDEDISMVAFQVGFENGARYVNSEITILSRFYNGDQDDPLSDPAWGMAAAGEALNEGADVVFAAGGQTGEGALALVGSAASESTPPYCIGANTDQWNTLPQAQPCLASSAIKVIDGGIATLILAYAQGNIVDGNMVGQAGLASYHDFEGVIPQIVKEELIQVGIDLAEGRIDTGYSVG